MQVPAFCGWAAGGAILCPVLWQAGFGAVSFFMGAAATGIAAASAAQLRGRLWPTTAAPAVLLEVLAWVIAFAMGWIIVATVWGSDAPESAHLYGSFEDPRLAAAAAIAIFGLTGGTVTAIRWAPRRQGRGAAAAAVGGAWMLAWFFGVALAFAATYLLYLLISAFVPFITAAILGGALGGAVGGSLGEAALWLGVGLQGREPNAPYNKSARRDCVPSGANQPLTFDL